MNKNILLAIALSLLSSSAIADAAGTLYFSQDNNANGLYVINTATGAATLSGAGITGVSSLTVGLSLGDRPGTLLGSTWTQINRINEDGSGATLVANVAAEGMEYIPATGTLYTILNQSFRTVNLTTGTIQTTLASPSEDIEGLAYGNGVIYGLVGFGAGLGDLFSYNIAANTWTKLGNVGIQFFDPGLAFDPGLGLLYAIGNQDHNLYTINPNALATTLIGPTGLTTTSGGLAFEPVPEPSIAGVLGLGLAGFIAARKRFA